MKILLLGAAGFIGTNLTIELAKKTEDEITLVDRSKAFFKPIVSMDLKNVHILEADLTVDMDFDSILKDQEVVYHLVSTTVPTTSNQHISQELVSNVIFSANLFEACIRCGVKKVVFVSSGGTVYGKEVDCPLKEKTATNPISSYGVQKITIEKLLYTIRLYRGGAPQLGIYSGSEYCQGEGLGDIIIGPGFQAGDFIKLQVICRKQNCRRKATILP